VKTVAILAPDFPPSSLPPSVRIRLFVSHFASFGWRPIIITTDPAFYDAQGDADNERLLPPNLEIIRTRAIPLRFARRFGFGDIGIRSLLPQWRALVSLCRAKRVDLIFCSVPPYITMLLARMAFERFRIPYVIDYQDPWTTNYYWKLPRSQRPPKWLLAYVLARAVEPIAVRRAAHLVAVSQGTLDQVVEHHPLLTTTPSTPIPFGFEQADFDFLRRRPRSNPIFDPGDGLLHISYVGAYTVAMEPAMRGLFSAIQSHCKVNSRHAVQLRVHFVGTTYSGANTPRVLPLACEYGLQDFVTEWTPRVPFLDSLQIMLDSRLLLIVGSEEAHYSSSKVFPYLLSGRPILAVVHEGSDIVGFLKSSGNTQTVTFNHLQTPQSRVPEILFALGCLLAEPEPASPDGSSTIPDDLSASSMARRLAGVFDRVVAEFGR